MSFKEEKIGWAASKRGDIIHVSQASSGVNGYYCIGCRKEMMAKKGKIRVHHFSHLALYTGKGGCLLTDEDVRMLVAKDVLQRQKVFTLPPFYTKKKGKSLKVSGSETVKLSDVWIEPRLTFEKRQLKWFPGSSTIKDEPLLSPSALIYCVDGREYALYLVPRLPDKLSLADIQAAVRFSQIPAIIKVIPQVNSLYEIENIFRSFKQTYWLYYERDSSNNMDSGAATKGSEELAERERYLLPYEETVSCRKFRIKEAVRWLMECMESGDFRAAEGEIGERIREEERAVEEFLGKQGESQFSEVKFREQEEEIEQLIEKERGIVEEIESRLREKNKAAFQEAKTRLEGFRNREKPNLAEIEERERKSVNEFRREILWINAKLKKLNGANEKWSGMDEIEREIEGIRSSERKLFLLGQEAETRRNN